MVKETIPDHAGKTLLLVEDEQIIALNTAELLKQQGFQVICVGTGEEAVDLVARTGHGIDLVLMDIDLGKGMDGTQAARLMLASRDIPVLFLSSHIEKEIIEKAERIASYGYVLKDTPIAVLIASVRMAFKLHEAHCAIREKDLSYKALVENINDAIFTIDSFCDITYMSPAVAKFSRYRPEDFIGKNFLSFIHPDDKPKLLSRLSELVHDIMMPFEYRVFDKDGSIIWVRTSSNINYSDSGDIVSITGILSNITERKLAEEALRESESEMIQITNGIPLLIAHIAADLRYRFVNQVYADFYQMPRDSFMGKHIRDVLPASAYRAALPCIERVLDGEVVDYEIAIQKNDTMVTLKVTLVPHRDHDHSVKSYYAVAMDITERKKIEDQLNEARHFNQRILASTPNLIYIYDLVARRNVYINREPMELLDYTREQAGAMGGDFLLKVLHPEDAARVAEHFDRCSHAGDGEVLEIEYRMKNASGQWRWFRSRDVVFCRDSRGVVTQILGSSEDITRQKKPADIVSLAAKGFPGLS